MPDARSPGEGAAESGVIHDIGYRHYDGERGGRPAIRRAMYVESARGAYGLGRAGRTKVMPALLLAAICLPALISTVVRGSAEGVKPGRKARCKALRPQATDGGGGLDASRAKDIACQSLTRAQ